MQPLGPPALVAAYNARISGNHDYQLAVDILTMDERPVGTARLVDGQISILRDADVRRTATLTLLDPDHGLGLDADAVFEAALFADRLVRIRHMVEVPGFGPVTSTPFIGPIAKLNRNGATIDLECQDKTGLAILGTKPLTQTKGTDVVVAIRAIAAQRLGETRFRLPTGNKFRLGRAYSVSWPDESSPWAVMQQIAAAAGYQLFYSCDGYLTLRARSTQTLFEFNEDNITSAPAGDHDFAGVINIARASAGDKIVKFAEAPATHPLSPVRLGRNGVPRYLPSLADLDAPEVPDRPGTKRRKASKAQLKKYAAEMEKYDLQFKSKSAQAQATANATLAAGLPMTANIAFSAVPLFHLDVDDAIRLNTPEGAAVLPFAEATIPLVSGDMTVGVRRRGRPTRIRG